MAQFLLGGQAQGDYIRGEVYGIAPQAKDFVRNLVPHPLEPLDGVDLSQEGQAAFVLVAAVVHFGLVAAKGRPGPVIAQGHFHARTRPIAAKAVQPSSVLVVRVIGLQIVFALVDDAVVIGIFAVVVRVGIDPVEQEGFVVVWDAVVVLIDIGPAIQIGVESREDAVGILDETPALQTGGFAQEKGVGEGVFVVVVVHCIKFEGAGGVGPVGAEEIRQSGLLEIGGELERAVDQLEIGLVRVILHGQAGGVLSVYVKGFAAQTEAPEIAPQYGEPSLALIELVPAQGAQQGRIGAVREIAHVLSPQRVPLDVYIGMHAS